MIFRERWVYGALMFVFMALVTLVVVLLRRTRLGYYLLAVREDEEAARAAGINVLTVKLRGMALSAALTSVGGALFAMYLRFIDPPSLFSLMDVGLQFALLTLIGGIGTVSGPLLGAAFVVPLGSWLQAHLGGTWPGAHLIVLGVGDGAGGAVHEAWDRRRDRARASAAGAAGMGCVAGGAGCASGSGAWLR